MTIKIGQEYEYDTGNMRRLTPIKTDSGIVGYLFCDNIQGAMKRLEKLEAEREQILQLAREGSAYLTMWGLRSPMVAFNSLERIVQLLGDIDP